MIFITKNELVNGRFIKYMANLIYYNSINHDKKRRIIANRYPLILENNDLLESASYTDEIGLSSLDLKDHITDDSLYKAFETLTEQQQKILSLAYVKNLTDKEIAILLKVSQQNISKHRLKALDKLRRLLVDREKR